MAPILSFQELPFAEDLISARWQETPPLPESLLLLCLTPVGSPGLDRAKFSSREAKAIYFKTEHYLFKGRGRVFKSATFAFLGNSGSSAWFKVPYPQLGRGRKPLEPYINVSLFIDVSAAAHTLVFFTRPEKLMDQWPSDYRHWPRERRKLS